MKTFRVHYDGEVVGYFTAKSKTGVFRQLAEKFPPFECPYNVWDNRTGIHDISKLPVNLR